MKPAGHSKDKHPQTSANIPLSTTRLLSTPTTPLAYLHTVRADLPPYKGTGNCIRASDQYLGSELRLSSLAILN